MPRSGEEVRRRLQFAALALYSRQGYDATTAAEIAAEAGVTERTFFRHFPDKREVLFDDDMPAALAQAVAEVPGAAAPLAVLRQAMLNMAPGVERSRPFAEPRSKIIAETPALRERQLAKLASMQDAAAQALSARGIPDRQAMLAARLAMAALAQAMHDWKSDWEGGFGPLLTRAFDDLSGLCLQPADGAQRQVRSGTQPAVEQQLPAARELGASLTAVS
jgi:AcrR family transcriptional regulator